VRIALISDIHGNMDALEVVLADIDRRIDTNKGDQIWCLGDIIGYGPDPVPCVDTVARRCKWALMGNHDFGVLYEPTNFNAVAEAAAYWTRSEFEAEAKRDREGAVKRWEFLGKLRVRVSEGPFLCVHGTPRQPINEYLFPEDAESSPNKMQQIFDRIEHFCLVGHTHVPGVFTGDGDFYLPTEMGDATWQFKAGEKVIVNPGSVGQPRDLDPRASYAIIDADIGTDAAGKATLTPKTVQFFRIEYPIEPVRAKIARVAEQIAARSSGGQASGTGAAQKSNELKALIESLEQRQDLLHGMKWMEAEKARWEQVRTEAKDNERKDEATRHIVRLTTSMVAAHKSAESAKRPEVGSQEQLEAISKIGQDLADARVRLAESEVPSADELARRKAEIARYNWLGDRLIEGR